MYYNILCDLDLDSVWIKSPPHSIGSEKKSEMCYSRNFCQPLTALHGHTFISYHIQQLPQSLSPYLHPSQDWVWNRLLLQKKKKVMNHPVTQSFFPRLPTFPLTTHPSLHKCVWPNKNICKLRVTWPEKQCGSVGFLKKIWAVTPSAKQFWLLCRCVVTH